MQFGKKNWAYYFNYLGIVVTLAVSYDSWRDSLHTDKVLKSVSYQQENLRDLLWINLLMQRSANLVLSAQQTNDPQKLEWAKNIATSISVYLDTLHDQGNGEAKPKFNAETRKAVTEFQAQLQDIDEAKFRDPQTQAQMNAIAPMVGRTGEHLNKMESQEWFQLKQLYENLLLEKEKQGLKMRLILGLLLGYLLFLGWIIRRKDIAEKAVRESEAKMVNSAKMSALGEMAGGVAHEINNPLATIGLLAEQAQEVMKDPDGGTAFVKEALERIQLTSNRIAAIVKGLRAFSRESSGDPLQHTPVEEIVRNTLSFCQEKLKHAGIDLQLTPIPPALVLNCRTVQVSQVLLNLLSNSCDAIADLPERWIRIAVAEAGPNVEISVTDSGKGIDSKTATKVFQPFFTTKEVGKGTGLGLSISKGIAESHGGALFLDRQSPNTRFVLRMPRDASQPPAKRA